MKSSLPGTYKYSLNEKQFSKAHKSASIKYLTGKSSIYNKQNVDREGQFNHRVNDKELPPVHTIRNTGHLNISLNLSRTNISQETEYFNHSINRILMHMIFGFVFLFLLISHYSNGMLFICWYQLIIFITLWGIAVDSSRLLYFYYKNSMIWWLISLIPYAYSLIIMPASTRTSFSILWIVLVNCCLLQLGQSNASRDMILNFFLSQLLNILSEFFYGAYFGICVGILDCIQIKKLLLEKLLMISATLLLLWNYVLLERLIASNAKFIVEKEQHLQQLNATNIELERQMKFLAPDQLESPLEKAILILKNLIENVEDNDIAEKIINLIGTFTLQ